MGVAFEIEVSQKGGKAKTTPFYIPLMTEITVGQFVKFQETVENNKPKSLKDYEDAKDEGEKKKLMEKIELSEITDTWTDYFIDFVQYWTEVPDELMELMDRDQLSWIYKCINININTYKPTNRVKFKHKNVTYHFPPAPENTLIKQKDYMRGTRIIDAVEAFQFEKYAKVLSKSEWGALPYLLAILCRKYEEQLPLKSTDREKFIADRKKVMEDVTLDIAFDLSFFLSRQKSTSQKYSLLYSLLEMVLNQRQSKKKTGTGTVGS